MPAWSVWPRCSASGASTPGPPSGCRGCPWTARSRSRPSSACLTDGPATGRTPSRRPAAGWGWREVTTLGLLYAGYMANTFGLTSFDTTNVARQVDTSLQLSDAALKEFSRQEQVHTEHIQISVKINNKNLKNWYALKSVFSSKLCTIVDIP